MHKEHDSIVSNFILTIKPIEAVVRIAKSDSESADNGTVVPLIDLSHKNVIAWKWNKRFQKSALKKMYTYRRGYSKQ